MTKSRFGQYILNCRAHPQRPNATTKTRRHEEEKRSLFRVLVLSWRAFDIATNYGEGRLERATEAEIDRPCIGHGAAAVVPARHARCRDKRKVIASYKTGGQFDPGGRLDARDIEPPDPRLTRVDERCHEHGV